LGQNFVIDPNTIRKMIDVARIGPHDRILELGAGAGSLTMGLAAAGDQVIAVEIDDRLVELLRESFEGIDNVSIVHADAMTLSLGELDATALVGNLPYNIATHLVLRVLEESPQIARITVMTQKEVGERLAAHVGSKSYGQTSVMTRYYGDAEVVAQISRRAFYPVPNVDSVVVSVTRGTPPAVDRDELFSVIRAGFSQRRKTLRNTLAPLSGDATSAAAALARAGISPSARAEELSLDDFVRVSEALR
jgi:16S rRNA (adenine1518-N6/adenine1519-N6)-dimethyltransferase